MAKGQRTASCRACFENGREHTYRTRDCQAYNAQTSWNRLMRRLAADEGRSVRTAPPSPDYSTPEAVTERAREAGTIGARWAAAGESDGFGRLYRAFRKVAMAAPCRVEDLHVSAWRVRLGADGQYELVARRADVA